MRPQAVSAHRDARAGYKQQDGGEHNREEVLLSGVRQHNVIALRGQQMHSDEKARKRKVDVHGAMSYVVVKRITLARLLLARASNVELEIARLYCRHSFGIRIIRELFQDALLQFDASVARTLKTSVALKKRQVESHSVS